MRPIVDLMEPNYPHPIASTSGKLSERHQPALTAPSINQFVAEHRCVHCVIMQSSFMTLFYQRDANSRYWVTLHNFRRNKSLRTIGHDAYGLEMYSEKNER